MRRQPAGLKVLGAPQHARYRAEDFSTLSGVRTVRNGVPAGPQLRLERGRIVVLN